MTKIEEIITLRSNDTQENDTIIKYNEEGVALNITNDAFYLYIKPNNQSSKNVYKLNTIDNPTELFVQNTNELAWHHGLVYFAPETYTYFIKRVPIGKEFTELFGTLIVEPEVVKK
jgi:hypothetical protein